MPPVRLLSLALLTGCLSSDWTRDYTCDNGEYAASVIELDDTWGAQTCRPLPDGCGDDLDACVDLICADDEGSPRVYERIVRNDGTVLTIVDCAGLQG